MENDIELKKKDPAIGKILLFVIGALFGAIVATSAFLIAVNVTKGETGSQSSQQGGTPPEMPSGDSSQNSQGGNPPEKPSEDNSQSSN